MFGIIGIGKNFFKKRSYYEKIFSVLLAVLMLTGCTKSGGTDSDLVFDDGGMATAGAGGAEISSDDSSALLGVSSVSSSGKPSAGGVDNAPSVMRLTENNRWDEYQFSVKSTEGEIVNIENLNIIIELWNFLWDAEHVSKPIRFDGLSEGASRETNFLPTDELIMKSALDDKEYTVRAGYVSETFSNGPDVVTDTPVVIIEGIENSDMDHVCYEDFLGVFELLLDGLAEKVKLGDDIIEPREKEKLTNTRFEDCEFSGKAELFERETLTTTKYSGTLTEDAARKIWELLTEIENTEPIVFDDDDSIGVSSYSKLVVRNTRVNKSWTAACGILYDHPMEGGGPVVVAVRGNYYYTFEIDGVFVHDWLDELIAEGIAREENIVWQETAEPKSAKPDIVLVENYCNYAWGYQNGGAFVDLDGNIYKFDLTDIDPVLGEEFVKVLEYRHFNDLLGDPVGKFDDVEKLREIAVLADQIPEDAKIKEDHRAYDAGQRTVYAMTSEHALVEIYSDGDYRRVNTDPSAKKIAKMWEKLQI